MTMSGKNLKSGSTDLPAKCKICQSPYHYQTFCAYKKKKRPKQIGKATLKYNEWRDTVAKPYLIKRYGNKCAICGETKRLDVDHIQKRGSHPHLKFELTNLRLLCRDCHIKAT